MLNLIWLGMLCLAVVVGIIQGRLDQVAAAVTSSAKLGFEQALSLTAVMSLWLGIMRIASESGVMAWLARCLNPVMRFLFPEIPPDHPAIGAIVMNLSANVLGMANAATPFGIQAMQELQKLNRHKDVASNAMCVFLAVNTSSVQLIPTTAIAYLAINGAQHPSSVIVTSLIATFCSTAVAIIAVKYLSRLPMYRITKKDPL